tara:strand:- start:383 stop:973 length:591 start_codon:yes stop_codon:yes gene_type:complete
MNIFKKSDIIARTQHSKGNNLLELNKFEKMHKIVESKLGEYLSDYALGNVNKLNDEFTDNEYKSLGLIIGNQNNFRDVDAYNYNKSTFIKYCSTFHRVLDGLHIAIINNNELITRSEDLSGALDILSTADNLLDYYAEKYLTTGYRFQEYLASNTSLTQLEFKHEYRVYIQKFGVPPNFNFESEKLSAIRLELGIT